MTSDFKELIKGAQSYKFDPDLLDAVSVTGALRKSDNPDTCILVLSGNSAGDRIVEIELDDVVKHEAEQTCKHSNEDRVTLYIKPTAIVATSFKGTITNALIAIRQPSPFSRVDQLLNVGDLLSWTACRAAAKEACENQFPPEDDREDNQNRENREECITNGYIECGRRPRVDFSGRELERLRELFGPRP